MDPTSLPFLCSLNGKQQDEWEALRRYLEYTCERRWQGLWCPSCLPEPLPQAVLPIPAGQRSSAHLMGENDHVEAVEGAVQWLAGGCRCGGHMLLYGPLGIGKTTTIHLVAQHMAAKARCHLLSPEECALGGMADPFGRNGLLGGERVLVPVVIPLGWVCHVLEVEAIQMDYPLSAALVEALGVVSGDTTLSCSLELCRRQGRLALLCDGLDETGSKRAALEALFSEAPFRDPCPMIVTTHDGLLMPQILTQWQWGRLLPLSRDATTRLLASPSTGFSPLPPPVFSPFTSLPLNAAFICLLRANQARAEEDALPGTRCDLYGRVIARFLGEGVRPKVTWVPPPPPPPTSLVEDDCRSGTSEEAPEVPHAWKDDTTSSRPLDRRDLMRVIAKGTFRRRKFCFTRSDAESLVCEVEPLRLLWEEVLVLLRDDMFPLFTLVGRDPSGGNDHTYRFCHPILQEFLAAERYIVKLVCKLNAREESPLLKQHLKEKTIFDDVFGAIVGCVWSRTTLLMVGGVLPFCLFSKYIDYLLIRLRSRHQSREFWERLLAERPSDEITDAVRADIDARIGYYGRLAWLKELLCSPSLVLRSTAVKKVQEWDVDPLDLAVWLLRKWSKKWKKASTPLENSFAMVASVGSLVGLRRQDSRARAMVKKLVNKMNRAANILNDKMTNDSPTMNLEYAKATGILCDALKLLGALSERNDIAIMASVIELLEREEPEVQDAAVNALACVAGRGNRAMLGSLTLWLKHVNRSVRKAVIRALGAISERDNEEVISLLLFLVSSSEMDVRKVAGSALGEVVASESCRCDIVNRLLKLRQDDDEETREAAMRVIVRVAQRGEDLVLEQLGSLSTDEEVNAVRDAILAARLEASSDIGTSLGASGSTPPSPPLTDPSGPSSLSPSSGRGLVLSLAEWLRHSDERIRSATAEILDSLLREVDPSGNGDLHLHVQSLLTSTP